MPGGDPEFANLMAQAHRVSVALDGFAKRDGSEATSAAVSKGKRVYSEIMDYQRTAGLTMIEARVLQSTVDLLRARLRFFREAV
jgi:hypothetical protein